MAECGARLWLEGWAPLLIFSGGLGSITSRLWSEPEADQFAAVARGMGVPDEKILIENASTNTGENILLTKKLLDARGIDPRRFIVVQKPYMERRSFATFRKLWPEPDVIVTSPKVTLDGTSRVTPTMRCRRTRSSASWSATSSGSASIPPADSKSQDMPAEVWEAAQELIRAGYDSRLVAATTE